MLLRRIAPRMPSLKRGRALIGRSGLVVEKRAEAGPLDLSLAVRRYSSSPAPRLPFLQSPTLRFRSVPSEGFATASGAVPGVGALRDIAPTDLRTPVDVYVSEELRGIGMYAEEIEEEVRKLKELGVSNLGVLQKLKQSDWASSGCSERAATALRNALQRSNAVPPSPSTLSSALGGRTISMERSVSRSPSLKRDFA